MALASSASAGGSAHPNSCFTLFHASCPAPFASPFPASSARSVVAVVIDASVIGSIVVSPPESVVAIANTPPAGAIAPASRSNNGVAARPSARPPTRLRAVELGHRPALPGAQRRSAVAPARLTARRDARQRLRILLRERPIHIREELHRGVRPLDRDRSKRRKDLSEQGALERQEHECSVHAPLSHAGLPVTMESLPSPAARPPARTKTRPKRR